VLAGAASYRQQLRVGSAFLGFGADSQFHSGISLVSWLPS
jgi:hypothetical protein